MARICGLIALLFVAAGLLSGCDAQIAVPPGGPVADWPAYGQDQGGSRYSPLTQINKDNVNHLRVAWTYRTGDVSDGTDASRGTKAAGPSAFEATPILVDGTLYLCTPFNSVIALDPETGTLTTLDFSYVDLSGSSRIEYNFDSSLKQTISDAAYVFYATTDLTLDWGMIAVQGPAALEIMRPLVNVDLPAMKYYSAANARIGPTAGLVI